MYFFPKPCFLFLKTHLLDTWGWSNMLKTPNCFWSPEFCWTLGLCIQQLQSVYTYICCRHIKCYKLKTHSPQYFHKTCPYACTFFLWMSLLLSHLPSLHLGDEPWPHHLPYLSVNTASHRDLPSVPPCHLTAAAFIQLCSCPPLASISSSSFPSS